MVIVSWLTWLITCSRVISSFSLSPRTAVTYPRASTSLWAPSLQAWRLYLDHPGAFATTIIPDDDGVPHGADWFESLQSCAFTGGNATVAVPSRLYFEESRERPLAEKRITVKDNMHIRGVVQPRLRRTLMVFWPGAEPLFSDRSVCNDRLFV